MLQFTCIPRYVQVSWVAEDLKRRAKLELQNLLTCDQIAINVVGYIAGCGGGLTRNDLSELTEAPPHKLDPILRGVFGRSLETRSSTYYHGAEADPAMRVYLFAHETLRVAAEELLGSELARYRQAIHDWIRSYANQGWPATTPSYAVRGYAGLLTATSDSERLSTLARDARRHAFLLRVTGSDYAALTEMRTTQRVIAAQDAPDLQALVELCVYRHAIASRNQAIPIRLPAVWARLARFEHAEALARTITDRDDQAEVLIELAAAIGQAGDADRAEALARSIVGPYARSRALAGLAAQAGRAGDRDRAFRLADDVEALARSIADTSSSQRSESAALRPRPACDGAHGPSTLTSVPDEPLNPTLRATRASRLDRSDLTTALARTSAGMRSFGECGAKFGSQPHRRRSEPV